MPITRSQLEEVIKIAFPNAIVHITDLAGDNDHWSVEITHESFKNLSRIAQHKLVQRAVEGQNIHALQIKTSS